MARFDEERIVDFDSWHWLLAVTGYIVALAFGSYLAVQAAAKFGSNLYALLLGAVTAVFCHLIIWFGVRVQMEDSQSPPAQWDRALSIVNLGLVMLFIWYVYFKQQIYPGVGVSASQLAFGGLFLGNAIVSILKSFGLLKVRRKLRQP